MRRPRVLVLSGSLPVLLSISCTSHQTPVSQTGGRKFIDGGGLAVSTGIPAAGTVDPGFAGEDREAAEAAAHSLTATGPDPIAFYAVNMVETPPLSVLPSSRAEADPTQSQPGREINELNSAEAFAFPERLKTSAGVASTRDGAISAATSGVVTLPGPIMSFDGNSSANNTAFFGGTVAPPDTEGAVGPDHYVQYVNLLVGVYNKSTGALIGGRFALSSVFAGLGGVCATTNDGDPIVLYDKLANRWVLSQFGFVSTGAPPYHECVAVSRTPDPLGSYYAYDFVLPGQQFPDYPKLGAWPDAYYMTTNQFFLGVGADGAGAFAFDRRKMLAGDPTAGAIYFDLCANPSLCTPSFPEFFRGMLPSDFDGLTPPPAGAKNVFAYPMSVTFGDPTDGARLFEFTPNFDTPASSTFVERADSPAPLAAYEGRNPIGRGDVREPSPGEELESLASRFMHRLQYMNRGGVETWTSNITVNVSGVAPVNPADYRAAPRWFTLTRGGGAGGVITTLDQATFAPDPLTANRGRWMGSAALDSSGNLALGYNRTSTAAGDFPSLYYTGRESTDPLGTLQPEVLLFAGLGTQTGTRNRWGDYSAMQLDPVDHCTLWYTGEYYPPGNTSFNWRTRIVSLKFPSCVTPPMGRLTGKVTYCQNGRPIKGAVLSVSDGHGGATLADGSYSINLPPGAYNVSAADPFANCATSSSQQVTITNGGTATANFCLSGTPLVNLVAGSYDDSGGNNNGVINRDENFRVNAKIENDGCEGETGISAVLSTSTPGVVVDQPFSTYPDLRTNESASNDAPYRAHTTPGFVCGTPIAFTLAETGNLGGTRTFHFSFPTCLSAPPRPFSGTLIATDATEFSRLGRNTIVSVCAAAKPCPGLFDIMTRHYDTFSFQNTSAVTECLTITLDQSGCSGNLLAAAYLDSFDATNICANYLGDAGGSPPVSSFSVNVPSGHALIVGIQEVAAAGSLCPSGYSGTVTGFIDDTPASAPKLNALSPAHAWIGLKNSDDVGTNFDLKAEVYRNGALVGSGEVADVSGGSSGFNNAKNRTIALALASPGTYSISSGDTLSIKLSVRIGATGNGSGTARLWYNDSPINSRFDVTIGDTTMNLYLQDGFVLGTRSGAGPKLTIDVFADRAVGGNPWKPFGTWIKKF